MAAQEQNDLASLHPRILRAKEKQHLIAVKTEFHDGESSRPIKQEVVESEPTRAIKKQVLHGETPAEASGSSNALDDDDDEPPGRVTGSGPGLQARGEVQTFADSPTLGPHRPLSGQDQQAIMALRWYTQWALEGLLCALWVPCNALTIETGILDAKADHG